MTDNFSVLVAAALAAGLVHGPAATYGQVPAGAAASVRLIVTAKETAVERDDKSALALVQSAVRSSLAQAGITGSPDELAGQQATVRVTYFESLSTIFGPQGFGVGGVYASCEVLVQSSDGRTLLSKKPESSSTGLQPVSKSRLLEQHDYVLSGIVNNPSIRYLGAYLAIALGRSTNTETDVLITALRDESAVTREHAVRRLRELKNPASVDALITALKDTSQPVRVSAAQALGELGDARAVDALTEMAQADPDPYARTVAQKSLDQVRQRRQ